MAWGLCMPRNTPRDPSAIKAVGWYDVRCFDAEGNLKWEECAKNKLMDEGEQSILDVYLRGATAPTNFFIGLLKTTAGANEAAIAETQTLSGLPVSTHEPTNTNEPGYSSRLQVNRDNSANGWPTLALDTGDYKATSKLVSWTASGAWAGTIRFMFLTTNGTVGDTTGKLLSVAQFATDRTLASGDRLEVTYNLKLQ
jgi:hypothetical protein